MLCNNARRKLKPQASCTCQATQAYTSAVISAIFGESMHWSAAKWRFWSQQVSPKKKRKWLLLSCLDYDRGVKVKVKVRNKYDLIFLSFHLLFHCHYFLYLVLFVVLKFYCIVLVTVTCKDVSGWSIRNVEVHEWKFLQHALSRFVYNRSLLHNFTHNVQVQYIYQCSCLCLIFDQITMAEEQKYLRNNWKFCCHAPSLIPYYLLIFIKYFKESLSELQSCLGNWYLVSRDAGKNVSKCSFLKIPMGSPQTPQVVRALIARKVSCGTFHVRFFHEYVR